MKIGRLSENIYKRSVLKELKYKRKEIISGAGIGNNCAVFSPVNGEAVTSMAFMAGKSDQIGPAAIYRAVNQIAASGAEPVAVTGVLLLTEEISEEELKTAVRRMEKTCEAIGIQMAGIDVSVIPQTLISRTDTLMLTITCIGKITGNDDRSDADRCTITGDFSDTDKGAVTGRIKGNYLPPDQKTWDRPAKPGQDVVLTKWVGLEGTYLIAREKETELRERFSAEYIEEAKGFDRYLSIIPEAATAMESGVGALHHVSEGGIFGALWEMAERSGVGLEIELKKIPIRQETVEICNYYDINPYALLSSGCLLMTADKGHDLMESLHKKGINATVIGRTTDSNDRLIINEEEKRFLTPAQQDEYFKLV